MGRVSRGIPVGILGTVSKEPVAFNAIHKAAGLRVPGHSIILTGTIPVEQKSVDWLSMGAASRNALWGGGIPAGVFLEAAGN